MAELPLSGGRVTPGVVRVGETVRRPLKSNSRFVRQLLMQLHENGFDAAPRYLGSDEEGREIFSFLPGNVPPDLDPAIPDDALAAAAILIRRFHDATAGTELAGGQVVCHHDLSPCNFVFRDGAPVAIIDFDAAAPGTRLQDLGYALFLWLNLGTDGPTLDEQARRVEVFCGAYGVDADHCVTAAILSAMSANVERLRADRRLDDAVWWQAQLEWLSLREGELVRSLRP